MAELLYFTFGSNMLQSQMQARCPDSRFRATVRIDGYELCFPMISFTRGGMGVASIRRNKDAYIEGIVYEMTENDIARMDRYENEGTKYRRAKIKISGLEGVETYFSRLDDGHHYPPSEEYLNAVIQGATEYQLSDEYLQTLRAFKDRKGE